MRAASSSPGNLLINGGFLPGLWSRLAGHESGAVFCPVEARTFAADRWHLRYAAPMGGAVSQARSEEVPPDATAESSWEIRGGEGVAQNVLCGQTIEADEAPAYRRELRLTAWCQVEHPALRECQVRLVVSHATARDVFDTSVITLARAPVQTVAVNAWTRLDFTFDARAAGRLGLCVELEFFADFLCDPAARVRLSGASLGPASGPEPAPRNSALETLLARRFFQRHSGETVNAIGRALACNPHELYFQFSFPEMRAFPAITLPPNDADLGVFSSQGVRQAGFTYDAPHCARGSAVIRATKWNHELGDGYLAFHGYHGAILLDAEL
jgi:hypothetical protein